jgi:hypothetical protein
LSAVVAAPADVAATSPPPKVPDKVFEEKPKEEEADVDMGNLFGDDGY